QGGARRIPRLRDRGRVPEPPTHAPSKAYLRTLTARPAERIGFRETEARPVRRCFSSRAKDRPNSRKSYLRRCQARLPLEKDCRSIRLATTKTRSDTSSFYRRSAKRKAHV